MTTRSFLALSLVLPFLFGLIGWSLPDIAGFFMFSLFLGAIPYIPFSVALAFLIKRSTSMRHLVVLSLLAPPAFALWLMTIFVLFGSQLTESLSQATKESAYFAIYALMLGYFYVVLAWVLWAGARWMRLVRNEFAT